MAHSKPTLSLFQKGAQRSGHAQKATTARAIITIRWPQSISVIRLLSLRPLGQVSGPGRHQWRLQIAGAI